MSKRLARCGVAAGCRGLGLVAWAERRLRQHLVVLCYHRVLPGPQKAAYPMPDLVVTPQAFDRHCRVLARHYEVLPLSAAWARLHDGAPGQRPLAAITFDDGYRDNHQYAAPILQRHGLTATFFVIAGLAGCEAAPWYDRLARAAAALGHRPGSEINGLLNGVPDHGGPGPGEAGFVAHLLLRAKQAPPQLRRDWVQQVSAAAGLPEDDARDVIMNWAELRDLAGAGHEIGSHSASHELLPQLPDDTLELEVDGSKRTLEAGLERPVRSFCYPNGDHDDRVAARVAAAGFDCAVTVQPGPNPAQADPFRLRRWFIHEERLAGVAGPSSATLLRMELSRLADAVFVRRRRTAGT